MAPTTTITLSSRPNKKLKRDGAKPAKSLKDKAESASKRSVSFVEKDTKGKGKEKARAPTPPPSKKQKTTGKSKPDVTEDAAEPEEPLPTSFKIITGSYEKLLYGLDGTLTASTSSSDAAETETETEWSLKPIFMFPAHVSSVKAVAASPHGGKWLASGSSDEIIKVWDLRRRKEVGGLMHHQGSITHLLFPSRSHLLSASEDGTLALFRARDWAVLRTLKGHTGRINSVAVHPSGKLALSVGRDRTLRMWDLMRGKGSASTKLGVEGELVRWAADGSMLVVQYQRTIDVYTTDLSMVHTITHPTRIQDVKFATRPDGSGQVLLVAAEDKKTTAYVVVPDPDVQPRIIASFIGHGNRVKAIETLRVARADGTATTVLGSVSSDGSVHAYDLAKLPEQSTVNAVEIEPSAKYDTNKTRLTCIALADGDAEAGVDVVGKRKRVEVEQEDEWESEVEEEAEEEAEEEDE
ncbi:WD40 repeat-like protein [Peniophora sp. CONT]|nr:WD40 repeat-like protein [Peniophora sp. CONT]